MTDGLTYSTFGELSTYQASSSGSPQLNVQYTRDSLGRITQKLETIGGATTTTVYGYDQAGRLTDVTVNGALSAHYDYDGNGNRLAVTRPGTGTVSGTYDAQDRLVTYGAVSYTYTANGDLQTVTSGGQTTTYTYDVFGNLTAVGLPNGTQIEYVIDGQNRRIGKKVNGTLAQGFLYRNQLAPVAELDGAGNVVSRFIYGTRINVPDYMVRAGTTYRLLTDHLGSVRLIVDTAAGDVAQRLDYDEFGQITLDTNPGFQPFGFAGGLYDQHTKLTRFGARDYDAFSGRWTKKDPIRFAGADPNLYGYVFYDPVNAIDPSGLSPVGWIMRLTRSGYYKVAPLFSKAAAVEARKHGENVLAESRQLAKAIERANAGGQDILRHKGHTLPDGSQGMPHYQTPKKPGHTFWGILGLLGSLLDPFDAISGELDTEEKYLKQLRSRCPNQQVQL